MSSEECSCGGKDAESGFCGQMDCPFRIKFTFICSKSTSPLPYQEWLNGNKSAE